MTTNYQYSLLADIAAIEGIQDRDERHRIADGIPEKLARIGGSPLFDKNGGVILIWYGEAANVGVLGDMNHWISPDPMTRIADTKLWIWRGRFALDARLEYMITTNYSGAELDPFNPWHGLNGLGPTSELAMPYYCRDPDFIKFSDGSRGRFDGLKEYIVHSELLGYSHTIHEFRWGVGAGDLSLWFQDGLDYIACARAPFILDRLGRSGKLPPFRAYFITPPNLHKGIAPDRSTEYGLNPDYIRCVCDELVPFLETRDGSPLAKKRIVVGDSYGGLISIATVLRRPDIFQAAYAQSPYASFDGDSIIHELAELPYPPRISIAVDCGLFERQVGASFIPLTERDFLEANRRLKDMLHNVAITYHYMERPESHTWGHWRKGLDWGIPLLAKDIGVI